VNRKDVQWEQLNKFAVDSNTMFHFENVIKVPETYWFRHLPFMREFE
jgi:hypothetical protein